MTRNTGIIIGVVLLVIIMLYMVSASRAPPASIAPTVITPAVVVAGKSTSQPAVLATVSPAGIPMAIAPSTTAPVIPPTTTPIVAAAPVTTMVPSAAAPIPVVTVPVVAPTVAPTPVVVAPTVAPTPVIAAPIVAPTPTSAPAPAAKILSLADCTKAGTSYLASVGHTPGRSTQTGAWGWVTPGCSVQSGGDWAIHYNTLATGADNAHMYTQVPDSYLGMGIPSNVTPGGEITSPDMCTAAGTKYLASVGHTPGRPTQSGSWSWVPTGCSVQSGGDWAIHWNTATVAKDTSNMYTVVPNTFNA